MNKGNQYREAVHWHDGMLLAPQHFQQNNLYLEQTLFNQVSQLNPFYFGVTALSIDQTALAASKSSHIIVRHIEGIMRDGTQISFSNHETNSSQDNLAALEFLIEDIDSIKVLEPFYLYLGVVKRSDANDAKSTRPKRYDINKSHNVADLYDSNNQIPLDRLRLRLKLMDEQEKQNSNYTCLPLLCFQKNQHGDLERLPYTPPTLQVTPVAEQTPMQSDLWQRLQVLVSDLEKKANERRSYFTGSNEHTPLSFTQKQEIMYINQHLPILRIMLNTGVSHPYDLYLALIKLSSSLSVMSSEGMFSQYMDYDHENLEKVFSAPMADIERVIKQIEAPYFFINFERNDKSGFSYQFDQIPASTALTLNLSFKLASGVTREELQDWIETALICVSDEEKEFVKLRSLGLSKEKTSHFNDVGKSESSDELLYTVDLSGSIGMGQFDHPPCVIVKGTDGNKQRFAPSAISMIKKRGEA